MVWGTFFGDEVPQIARLSAYEFEGGFPKLKLVIWISVQETNTKHIDGEPANYEILKVSYATMI